MAKKWYPKIIYIVCRLVANTCPICKVDFYKREGSNIALQISHVYRSSNTSFTMRCNVCGYKWTSTWRVLVRAIRKRYPDVPQYLIHANNIEEYFEIGKVKSPNPSASVTLKQ